MRRIGEHAASRSRFADRRRMAMDEDTGSVPGAVSGARARELAEQVRERALQASSTAAAYARDEPMKSLLIAAAAGALLMGLVSLVVRSND
jgi:ElaB/YqjD/DUF883 family membrane-anchored ribosome-binding protein